MKYGLGCLALFIIVGLQAQSIDGRIVDAINGQPLGGATVQMKGDVSGAVADEEGYFTIAGLNPARYQLTVSFLGYRSREISDVWVKAGKITSMEIRMERDAKVLDQVEVVDKSAMMVPGRRTITEEQINRFAASYYDPARLMTTSPDVALTNDQSNEISVRGISPNYNVWRLEGAEIVNPNHTPNAGTFSDQPAGTSGGVNILSAQMLANSSFQYGSLSNDMGNSVGGIFDMYLKKGISDDYQFTTQASLIGFDMAAEGPLAKGSRSSFSANYRYSFTGLLTGFGVDFGGESIGFQDVSANLNFPGKKGGNLKVFGVGGASYNNFTHLPFDQSAREKDRKDIYYDGKMGLTGARYEKNGFTGTVIYSGFANRRQETLYNTQDSLVFDTIVNRNENLLSTHLTYSAGLKNGKLSMGAIHNVYHFGSVYQALLQPYLNVEQYLSEKILVEGGVTFNVSSRVNVAADPYDHVRLDPRVRFAYLLTDYSELAISAGVYSQLLKPSNYVFASARKYEPYTVNSMYDFISSRRYLISYRRDKGVIGWTGELFYYDFPEVNYVNGDETVARASTHGVTLSADKNFDGNWYLLSGVSLFRSTLYQ
ncbi:MAG: carboxypeptidase-like regulatory domain-containing protein, partial [Cyclobacteriaceae bacterium]|nr:carboxypeptidase-like regulatory domain-containing protein [Cyclobacteriaceae bacterium]